MPDYPATNPSLRSPRAYLRMLWSIVEMFFAHPTLVQACLVGFFTSAPFTNFWTTLTFLLAGPPYEYSPLIIGLFALYVVDSIPLTPPLLPNPHRKLSKTNDHAPHKPTAASASQPCA